MEDGESPDKEELVVTRAEFEPTAELLEKLKLLPTGKHHVSFSELRDWKDCSYRHKLKHVQHIDLGKSGPLLEFGKAVHASCESFIRTREMNVDIAKQRIIEAWKVNAENESFKQNELDGFVSSAERILVEVPQWMDATFPNWEAVDAEHFLYEQVEERPHAFKGFIDAIIRCDGARSKRIHWVLDWKTTSWGWALQKKSDDMVRAQIVLYKSFWSKKLGIDPKDVRCGFVLLKRTAKDGSRCELVTVSAGDVTTTRSLKVVNNMLASVNKGLAIKNRTSCTYCDYKGTEHCK